MSPRSPETSPLGVVERNRSVARAFEIRNIALNPCIVRSARVTSDPDGSFALVDPFIGGTIAGGGSLVLRVEAHPAVGFDASGVVEIEIEGGDAALQVELEMGSRPPSDLLIIPDVLDFGSLFAGCDSEIRTLMLYNGGSREIALDDVTVTEGDAFHLLRLPAPILLPGESAFVDLIYRPIPRASTQGCSRSSKRIQTRRSCTRSR